MLNVRLSGIKPLPTPRPRIAVRGRFPVAYYPKAYEDYRQEIARLLAEFRPEKPLDGPLAARMCFYVNAPRATKLRHPKPDIDNFVKGLLDACTKAGYWLDDSQVVHIFATKRWTHRGELEGLSLEVWDGGAFL